MSGRINRVLSKYLERIQAEKRDEVDHEYLAHLQKSHVLNVHFENSDIINKKPLSLSKENLCRKIVEEQRGGVCYELNGLFYHLLVELGFQPYLMAGTVHIGDEIWAMENAHLFLIVHLDQEEYVVDVGFGGKGPRIPVPLYGQEIVDSDGKYKVKKEGKWYFLQKDVGEGWETLYRFEPPQQKWTFDHIRSICMLTETSVLSKFNKKYFFSRVLEDGRITLLGDTFIIVKGKEMRKEKLAPHEIVEHAQHYFRISLTM